MSERLAPAQGAASADPADSRERQLAGLKAAGNAKTQKARQKVENGIRDLIKTGARISVSSVARTSGVSRAFINKHPDLVERVHVLASQQEGAPPDSGGSVASGESAIIGALRRKLREQEERHRAETARLRKRIQEQDHQIAQIYGRL